MLRVLERKSSKKGFASMAEVIVASIIFMVTATGIVAALSVFREQSVTDGSKVRALYSAKSVIDDLYRQVDATTWNDPNGPFSTTKTFTQTFNDITIQYSFSDVPNLELRQMSMTVTYPD